MLQRSWLRGVPVLILAVLVAGSSLSRAQDKDTKEPIAPPKPLTLSQPSAANVPVLAPAVAPALPAVSVPVEASSAGAPRQNMTPADIVQRACRLSGVAGALVTTLDGFTVAGQMPSGINAETMAGFLPEIFNRLGKYTTELNLGEPTQVEVLMDKVPLHIVKRGALFFAVLGKASENLPKVQVSVLASQLSTRNQ